MPVPPAPAATHEDLLHRLVPHPTLLVFGERRDGPWLCARRGHRAIGVVYNPDRDRRNWVPTVMGGRYDAFVSFAETAALHPLHPYVATSMAERDTYPWST
jgi:erythromycin esterase